MRISFLRTLACESPCTYRFLRREPYPISADHRPKNVFATREGQNLGYKVRNTSSTKSSEPSFDMPIHPKADTILKFWLGDNYSRAPAAAASQETMKIWFGGGEEIDKVCKEKFSGDLKDAAAGKLSEWDSGYNGLASVILMDQLSRNIHRGSAKYLELDDRAINLAKRLQEGGSLSEIPPVQRVWLYMPLMHSEELEDQKLCVKRFESLRDEARSIEGSDTLINMLDNNVQYAIKHKEVVEKWGRFPHRNKIIGRANTEEEAEALKAGTIPNF